jgi:chlorobactene glucosyltransferase
VPFLDVLTLAFSAIPLGLNLVNDRVWPRADETLVPSERYSVLIPARNEQVTIAACVRAALAVQPPVHEVWVCDDHSTDQTPDLLRQLQAEDPRVKVLQGADLPPGWVGKPHACHQLGQAATGDVLLFVDADTELAPDATQRLAAAFARYNARVVTAFPHQRVGSWLEDLIVPLLPLTFTSWLPLDLIWKHVDPRFLIVNGQVLAFRREAYELIGGFAAVHDHIVDDMAICRRAKELDQRLLFIDGTRIAHTRMYRNAAEVWQGFSKNFYEGLGANPLRLAFVLTCYFMAFVFPYLRMVVELALGLFPWAAAIGVAFNLGARHILARRLGHSLRSVLLHPIGVMVLLVVAVNSMIWSHTGRIRWRGRTYASRQRSTKPPPHGDG